VYIRVYIGRHKKRDHDGVARTRRAVVQGGTESGHALRHDGRQDARSIGTYKKWDPFGLPTV